MCLNYLNNTHKLDMPTLMGKTRLFMAEREGFEPSWDLRPPLISNQGRLATPASLQTLCIVRIYR